MAKFFREASGRYGFRHTDAEELSAPIPGGSTVVQFDEAANQALVDSIDGKVAGIRWDDHTISGAQILVKGIAATINPDSTDVADRKALLAAAANAISGNQTFIANSSPTNAQVIAQVKALSQQNNHLIRRILQLTR